MRPASPVLAVALALAVNQARADLRLYVLAFLNAWAARDPASDFNEDGVIDTRDMVAFLNAWTVGC